MREPRTWLLLAFCAVIPVALLIVATRDTGTGEHTSCGQTSQTATISTAPGLTARHVITTGDAAPTFRLRSLECAPIDTAAYRGKPYVVTFWASWCGPCRKEMPLLQKAFSDRDGDLPIVGVSYQDPESESRAFASDYGIKFPLAPDDGYKIAKTFGVINVPTTFFIDRDGKVRDRVAGNDELKHLDAALTRLLAP